MSGKIRKYIVCILIGMFFLGVAHAEDCISVPSKVFLVCGGATISEIELIETWYVKSDPIHKIVRQNSQEFIIHTCAGSKNGNCLGGTVYAVKVENSNVTLKLGGVWDWVS